MSPLGSLHTSVCCMLQSGVHCGALSSYTSMQTLGHPVLMMYLREPGTLTYACGPGSLQLAGHQGFSIGHSLSSSQ